MNYLKIYEKLCSRGQFERNIQYVECHHIVPRCIGGDDSTYNLTKLTAKEHYFAHLLLTKIYPENTKLLHAFGMMKNSNIFQDRRFSSNQYSKMKTARSDAMKLNNPMFDEETKNKAMKTRKDRYESGEITPRELSDEEKCNISKRMMGDNNPTRKYPDKHNFKNNKYVLGKKCYNNGIVNKYFSPDEEIPDGFVKGNKPYKRVLNGKQSNHG